MYDEGNYLYIASEEGGWSEGLEYTQSCSGGGSRYSGTSDIYYSTCKYVGDGFEDNLFVAQFTSASSDIIALRVSGELGADGDGFQDGNSVALEGPGVYGYYKKVHGAGDPSVNHLVIVPRSDWTNEFDEDGDGDTDDGEHRIYGSTGVDHLLYLMWAGSYDVDDGYEYTEAHFQRVLDKVGARCFSVAAKCGCTDQEVIHDASADTVCVKHLKKSTVCRGIRSAESCPSDHFKCSYPAPPECTDSITPSRCSRKASRGKCGNRKMKTQCRATCGHC